MDDVTIITAATAGACFLIAGVVKGTVGFGLPLVSVALITVLIDLPTAMALLVVPAVLTNFWQAMVGPGTPGKSK